MTVEKSDILVGETHLLNKTQAVTGSTVSMDGDTYYRISHYDQMPPFFMSVVSSADHWLFIASTGGLTAGRRNSESALFPYETEDKIAAHHDLTGSKMIVRVERDGREQLWEPFSKRYQGIYRTERNLYKNVYGNKLVFEEINHDLELTVRNSWRTSDRFGFVKTGSVHNNASHPCQIELLDGVQNVLPYGVTSQLQTTMSSLLDAYKRNELEAETGLGLFTLSATLTDRAEPSESLKATVVWQVGLDVDGTLLSSRQVDAFRHGRSLEPEHDICGKAGAYLVTSNFELAAGQRKAWHIVADLNQDSADVTRLLNVLKQDQAALIEQLEADIAAGTAELVRYVAMADGLQSSEQDTTVAHHYANVLFNIMRGGIFVDGYQVERNDFLEFVQVRNSIILQTESGWFERLPKQLGIRELYAMAAKTENPNLIRLCYEYLPLTFSRRHGDPSRPWNRFSINLKKPDGSKNLDYEGNWRDIFQNWEPLALSFPAYTKGMIAKFLNATTVDGYNPYRLMREGIEWEVVEPDNPWANIGYWSDHQIIYLQKLLEIAEQVEPGALTQLWNQAVFAYANVPYRQRSYEEMLADWYTTIDFDWEREEAIHTAVSKMGTDGRLVRDSEGNVIHVTMIEKLLVLLLAKLTNLVPDGGIWMNTQRPEWNDANNALVGKGLSVVTAAYLRRFIAFWQRQLEQQNGSGEAAQFSINTAVATLFDAIEHILQTYQPRLADGFLPQDRKSMMDELGAAGTAYRLTVYDKGIPKEKTLLKASDLAEFLSLAQAYIEHTLHANRRPDGLGHTYNILRLEEDGVIVEHLYLMLEGQVGYLSSGLLYAEDALILLRALRQSDLYRADQHSYMLYPNRKLPGFLQKNNVTADQVSNSKLVTALEAADDGRLLRRDDAGVYHFNGRFRNANDVAATLDILAQEDEYSRLVADERDFILDLFEEIFDHGAFTGRSGTFFAFEGLGSIYWHMVSKLLLAVQECYQRAVDEAMQTSASTPEQIATIDALSAAYYDIRAGIGFNKSPQVYGAFPTDPYSHTPVGGGARQPGMTGQVKEEIMTRWGELGVRLKHGVLCFRPTLLRSDEYLQNEGEFEYVNLQAKRKTLPLLPGSLAFTFCQTPVVYQRGEEEKVVVEYKDGRSATLPGASLDQAATNHILNRDGQIYQIRVTTPV